jgi:esterase/lipase superfamily enzyme
MIDEPIAEIREIRHQISQECHHDTNTYLAYLWQQEDEYREQIERYRQMTIVNSIGDWQEMANRMSPVVPFSEPQPVPA